MRFMSFGFNSIALQNSSKRMLFTNTVGVEIFPEVYKCFKKLVTLATKNEKTKKCVSSLFEEDSGAES